MSDIVWKCQAFEALANHDLYAILRLRIEVFVVEQNCVFQDADNKDQQSLHLTGWVGNELAAYARIVPKGVAYEYVSIGRVVTSPLHRQGGRGKALMTEAISRRQGIFGLQPIRIGGQLYLKKFYETFGFVQISGVYMEDGIEHIQMLLTPGK